MPSSMTGFARFEAKHDWGTIVWEVRSVNHRYLEPTLRLPELVRELEPALRDSLRKNLSRGKVEISFNYQLASTENHELNVNLALVDQLNSALESIRRAVPDAAPVNPLELLRWPGVLADNELDRDTIHDAALAAFNHALENLKEHRAREGAELQVLIEQRLNGISEQVRIVRALMPEILKDQRQRLLDKLEGLKIDLDSDRLEQEIVYLAQKTDVDEELDRLDTHVTEVHRSLKQPGSVGRRLDFLMQELNREANTLSSKSIVCDTTQAAVELKVLIEQMREQIQNIE